MNVVYVTVMEFGGMTVGNVRCIGGGGDCEADADMDGVCDDEMNVLVFTTNVVYVMVQVLYTNVDVLIFQKEIVIVLEIKKMY